MRTRPILAALAALTLAAGGVGLQSTASTADDGARLFVPGAVLNADHTVTLPLHQGRSGNQTVWFVVTEASDSNHAEDWRASVSAKLLNARRTAAVQKVTLAADGTVVFPATVDFSPSHVVRPGPAGFPPDQAEPGAVGNPGYTPLIQLPAFPVTAEQLTVGGLLTLAAVALGTLVAAVLGGAAGQRYHHRVDRVGADAI